MKENCRDARGTRWLEDLAQDIRYALRNLRLKPGLAAASLLTLGLGTGATTVMFTLIHSVLLKPLPYADPARLAQLLEKTDWKTPQGDLWGFTYPNFLDARKATPSLAMAGSWFAGGTVTKPGLPEHVESREVTANLFGVLGVPLAAGRTFTPGEDRIGAPPAAIISDNLWRRRYHADPSALGSQLVFEGVAYTVVGIAPRGFRLLDQPVDIFTLIGQDASPVLSNRARHGLFVVARLRPNATIEQARAELAAAARPLVEAFPQSNRGRTFIAQWLRPDVDDVRSTLWILLGAVGMLQLIACANIASLLLAQSVARERELAMRVALGAGRFRLVRQCLTESCVLGLAGGLLGIALAAAGLRPFIAMWPGSLPRAEEVALDWRVLLFALAASLASGVIFGLAPALRAPSRGLDRALRSGGRALVGGSRRLQSLLVSAEVALAVVLLIAAGALGQTMLRLVAISPGVDIHNVLVARFALPASTLTNPARIRAAWDDILDRARRLPGVDSAATVDTVPMREGNNVVAYTVEAGGPLDPRAPQVQANSVSAGYLKVMGLSLRAGRFLEDHDRAGSPSVAVIDEVMAQQAFPGQNPIGKQVWIGLGTDPVTVVGVAGHVRYWGPAGDDSAKVRAQLYYPFAQVPDRLQARWSQLMSIAVRTRTDPLGVVEPLRRALRGATGDQALYQVQTMEEIGAAALAQQRFLAVLFGIFAALALVLACVGIYGVLAYLTRQRVPEIGVRMALGATAREVVILVLRQSLGMVAAGVALGSWINRGIFRAAEGRGGDAAGTAFHVRRDDCDPHRGSSRRQFSAGSPRQPYRSGEGASPGVGRPANRTNTSATARRPCRACASNGGWCEG